MTTLSKVFGVLGLLFLIIALLLHFAGFENVSLSSSFLALLKQCSLELNEFKISIPDIPQIPLFNNDNVWLIALNGLIFIANMFSTIINIISLGLNAVIQFIQFAYILIKNLTSFTESITPRESDISIPNYIDSISIFVS